MTDDELLSLATQTADRLLELGKWVSPDLRIYPEEAASIIGRSVGTLANWRAVADHPLKYVRGARITYRLVEVLRFVYSDFDIAA